MEVHQYAMSIAWSRLRTSAIWTTRSSTTPESDRSCSEYRGGTKVEFIDRDNLYLGRGVHPLRKPHFLGAATDCAPLLIRHLPKSMPAPASTC